MKTLSFFRYMLLLLLIPCLAFCQAEKNKSIDERVKKFLDENKNKWSDWNVPYEDGQVLYNLIIKNKYTSALEIGTSTGHSTIWIAWALSKTGGKLVTLEIDKERHQTALENLKAVGLSDYVDAQLVDAHDQVKKLKGPFDFVFSDADKTWYTQYFIDIDPKLSAGGCFTAHNVTNNFGGIKEFLDYVRKQSNYETTINKATGEGISISYKKR